MINDSLYEVPKPDNSITIFSDPDDDGDYIPEQAKEITDKLLLIRGDYDQPMHSYDPGVDIYDPGLDRLMVDRFEFRRVNPYLRAGSRTQNTEDTLFNMITDSDDTCGSSPGEPPEPSVKSKDRRSNNGRCSADKKSKKSKPSKKSEKLYK